MTPPGTPSMDFPLGAKHTALSTGQALWLWQTGAELEDGEFEENAKATMPQVSPWCFPKMFDH